MNETLPVTRAELEMLRRIPLFASLDAADFESVVSQLKRRRFRRGEIVYNQEDLPGSVYIMVSGIVKMRLQSPSGKQMTMSWIQPGSFFGTISLLDGQERLADAVVIESCELLVLGRDDFRQFLACHPREMEVLLEITAARWRSSLRRLADLAFLDVPGRLARTLLTFGTRAGDDPADLDVLRGLTHAELASLAVTSRETIGRLIKGFEEAGLIEAQRGRIRILDRAGLAAQIRW